MKSNSFSKYMRECCSALTIETLTIHKQFVYIENMVLIIFFVAGRTNVVATVNANHFFFKPRVSIING